MDQWQNGLSHHASMLKEVEGRGAYDREVVRVSGAGMPCRRAKSGQSDPELKSGVYPVSN